MSIGLHLECQNRLKQLLAENLVRIRVDKNVFLDYQSTLGLASLNKVLPGKGSLHDKLQNYIGENPLFDFVYETLSRDLYENGTYDPEKTATPLQEFPNYTDLKSVASCLVDDFESLPWSYLISFELPKSIGEPFSGVLSSYSLTSTLKVVVPNEEYDSLYPLQSGIKERDQWLFMGYGLLSYLSKAETWNKETVYIQMDKEGFIGRNNIKTMPIEEALGMLKSFIGLSLATRLMKVGEERTALPYGAPPKYRFIIHRNLTEGWQIWSTYELPTGLSATINKIVIDDLDGRIKAEQVNAWILNRLSMISTAFQNPKKAEHVLLAAQWLLDSYVGTNELLSFVQTTVAMEIMLGEESKSDVIGIGELLRNRCAYLIGKTHSQREEILKDFEKIYDLRSKIVHRGKSRLTYEERDLFYKLQWMCIRVINEEIELIAEDKKKDTT